MSQIEHGGLPVDLGGALGARRRESEGIRSKRITCTLQEQQAARLLSVWRYLVIID